MKITLHEITTRDISANYTDNGEGGVMGYGGKLNIRPAYQREFVYNEKKRNAVIETICNGFPLNVMYWVKNEDGSFEVLDGQQRTISFCQYINGDFSIANRAFHNLTSTEQSKILDYKVMVYYCEGNDKEKLDWFKIINIAGERLYDQELRNAIYTGPWLSDAKKWFSRTGAPAYRIASKYINGKPIRQDYLKTALDWFSDGKIEDYMSVHQHDPNAHELWRYFQDVIQWIELTFGTSEHYRNEMKCVSWGKLYNKFKDKKLDTALLEASVAELMQDDDVTKKSGIYDYVLTNNERSLNIRTFSTRMKREAYERQNGVCPICNKHFDIDEMEADHITPWSEGGKTVAENCQMLCKLDNRMKSNK